MPNNDFITISYAILTHNEDESLKQLLDVILLYKDSYDEIVIVDDYSDNPKTLEILKWVETVGNDKVRVYKRYLNGDFADQKNFMTEQCYSTYIVNLDADEMVTEQFMKSVKTMITTNKDKNGEYIEVFKLHRLNTVDGLSLNHLVQWRWVTHKIPTEMSKKVLDTRSDEYKLLDFYKLIIGEDVVDEKKNLKEVRFFTPLINYPDFQYRIYKNNKKIKWQHKVHEVLVNYNTTAAFPGLRDYSIIHAKGIAKQEQQNNFYKTIVP